MTGSAHWRIAAGAAAVLAAVAGAASPASAKGLAPKAPGCDSADKTRPGWTDCLGASAAALDDAQLYYAGYWLARTGRYEEALSYLRRARNPDERILTYTGFATRKLGDVKGALPFYREALARNPGYTVARAYLGEAYLTLGEPAKAREQLTEIEKLCGRACAEYAELAAAIASHWPQ